MAAGVPAAGREGPSGSLVAVRGGDPPHAATLPSIMTSAMVADHGLRHSAPSRISGEPLAASKCPVPTGYPFPGGRSIRGAQPISLILRRHIKRVRTRKAEFGVSE